MCIPQRKTIPVSHKTERISNKNKNFFSLHDIVTAIAIIIA